MSFCGVWCLATDPSWPLAATKRAPSPLHGHPGSRAEQGRLTVDPQSIIAPLVCPSYMWHPTTSQTFLEEDKYLVSREELKQKIAGIMGGRASEEVVFGDVSSGAENDIQRGRSWSGGW